MSGSRSEEAVRLHRALLPWTYILRWLASNLSNGSDREMLAAKESEMFAGVEHRVAYRAGVA